MNQAPRSFQLLLGRLLFGLFPKFCVLVAFGWMLAIGAQASAAAVQSVILVDKRTHDLHVARYVEGQYQIIKTYHATLGKVKGDKEEEGDLKTPEGIYTFTQFLTPPGLKAKFGTMAFYIGFPNAYDLLAGRTGRDIMLHATNEPDRLRRNWDSEGCVVVHDLEIREIKPYIELGRTPILIFPENPGLTAEYMAPGRDSRLKGFFEGWLVAWRGKQMDTYLGGYHSDFVSGKMDLAAWKTHKSHLNLAYSKIEVLAENVRYYRHPKYSAITFNQTYRSHLVGGGIGHLSRGTKELLVAEEKGALKIIAENFHDAIW